MLSWVAMVAVQAQSIPLVNGDCSTDAALTGISPYVISGFTITDATVKLDLAASGISGGALRIKGAANGAKQGDVLVTTEKVDVSSFPNTGVYTFNCTALSTVGSTGLINVAVVAYDAGGIVIPNANVMVGGAITKLQNQLVQGTAVTYGATFTMQPNSAGGNNVAYLTFSLQVAKYLVNDLRFDDFTLNCGTTAATTTVTPLTGVLTCEAGTGPSAESSFTVAGAGLGADVTVTPGNNLEISTTSGSGYVIAPATIILPQVGGTVASTTIYARIKGGINTAGVLSKGSVSVTITNPTAGKKTVVYTGTVTGVAATLGSDTLSYVPDGGPSLAQKFKVTGYKLLSDVVVTPGSNVEITTDSTLTTFTPSITLPKDTGTIAGTYVYVRLKSGLAAGNYMDATTAVTVSSVGHASTVRQFVGIVDVSAGVTKVNVSTIKLNVVNGAIKVTGVESGKRIDIFNSLGQKVKTVIASDVNTISLSSKGMYVFKVDTFVQRVILK